MITEAQLDEYLWAKGDIDGYARSNRDGDISTEEWFVIDRLLSAITMIRRGLAAPEFRQSHETEVENLFDCEATYRKLVRFERESRTIESTRTQVSRAGARLTWSGHSSRWMKMKIDTPMIMGYRDFEVIIC
jgi:hypothetical protein